jgi:hypothetical protein
MSFFLKGALQQHPGVRQAICPRLCADVQSTATQSVHQPCRKTFITPRILPAKQKKI